MTNLRKKIFYSKIHNVLTQNSFVLFFQYNNIQSKKWIFLRNEILKCENTCVLVIKNKITHEMFENTFEKSSCANTKNTAYIKKNPTGLLCDPLALCVAKQWGAFPCKDFKKIVFLCQGPTLIIAFKSIKQCKPIYEILEFFKGNLPLSTNLTQKNVENSLYKNKKLVSLFMPQNQKNNEKYNFFFVGGLVQNQVINYLDLVKLSTLDNFVYSDLINQYNKPLVKFLLFKNVLENKLLRIFKQNTLITILTIHKNNLALNASNIK